MEWQRVRLGRCWWQQQQQQQQQTRPRHRHCPSAGTRFWIHLGILVMLLVAVLHLALFVPVNTSDNFWLMFLWRVSQSTAGWARAPDRAAQLLRSAAAAVTGCEMARDNPCTAL